jgi:hypothetical protein
LRRLARFLCGARFLIFEMDFGTFNVLLLRLPLIWH